MTVGDLILQLESLDQDADVIMDTDPAYTVVTGVGAYRGKVVIR